MSGPVSNPPNAGVAGGDEVCDVLVVGSGAGGLSAAVAARALGADVTIVEKTDQFGGTTVSSAGVIWIPGSRQARAAGIADDPADVLTYLEAEGGNRLDATKARVYVDRAAEILAWFEDNTHLRFVLAPAWPDYHPEQPGGARGGRSLGPAPFDGRTLGPQFARLRPPLATTMILGGMIVGREDLGHFYGMQRSLASTVHVGKLFARYVQDRLTHARGTRLSNGSALVGMLARTAFEQGVRLHLETALQDVVVEDGRIVGAIVTHAGARRVIRARRGVVLATGGFPGSGAMRARYYDHVKAGRTHVTLAPATNTGDGLQAGMRVGTSVVEAQKNPAAWTPVSLSKRRDGSVVPFPHFFDRGKAGYIAVDRRGKRFVNEARSYHDFVPAMIDACRDDADVECHLICDSRAIRRYGLGMAPPAPGSLEPHVRSGYILRAETLEALAGKCGIDAGGLAATVAAFNPEAAAGRDPEFDKGGDVYQRFNGSAGQAPNPCLAPIETPPFYAIRLVPGDIGTFIGLRTDDHARALDHDGRVVDGLYVVGNDAASFMGGAYPGAGITLGPALVFGYLAARHVTGAAEAASPAQAAKEH